jgi:hypothetical protein
VRYLANNPLFAAGGDKGKIVDPHPSPQETQNTFSAIKAAHAALRSRGAPRARVLVPYTRYPLNAGDPASPDGTQISISELGPDTIAFIESQAGTGVPTTRKINTVLPLLIDGGTSADLSQDRTLSLQGAPSFGYVLTWTPTGWQGEPPTGSGGEQLTYEDFTPTAGQTVFHLAQVPAGVVWVVLNDGFYYEPIAFTVVGNTLTWSNPLIAGRPLTLDGVDGFRVYYEITPTFRVVDFGVGSLNPITPGQTSFTLPMLPGSLVFAVLNDGFFNMAQAFNVAGTTVTWLNPLIAGRPLTLDGNDALRFYF